MKFAITILLASVCNFLIAQKFELSVQSGHTGNVTKLAFSENSKFLASAGSDKKTIVSDLASYKQLFSVITENDIKDIFFLFHDSAIAVVETNRLSIWNIAKGSMEYEFRKEIKGAFPAPDEKLAVYTKDLIFLFDRSYKKVSERSLSAPFNQLILSENKKSLACIHETYNIGYAIGYSELENIASPPNYNQTKAELEKMYKLGTRDFIKAHPGLNRYYFAGANMIMGVEIGKEINYNKYLHPFTIFTQGWGEVYSAVDVGKKYLLTGSSKGFIYLYNSKNGKHLSTLNLHTEKVNSIALSKNEKYFASSSTNEIVLWDLEEKKPVHFFRSMSQPVSCFALSADRKKIITGSASGELKFWDMETNEISLAEIPLNQSKKARGFSTYISDVEYVNDSLVKMDLVIGNRQNYFVKSATTYKGYWHIKTNVIDMEPMKQYNFEEYRIETGFLRKAVHKKENFTVSAERTSLLWKDFIVTAAHMDEITCVKIDEENKIIYSSSADGVIKMWDIESGKELLTLLSYKTNYLYKTPENYYYASKGGLKNVAFKNGMKLYPFDQFDLQYNRPEKIIAVQPFFTQEQQTLFANAYGKRLKRLGIRDAEVMEDFSAAPFVEIEVPDKKNTKEAKYTLKFSAGDSTGYLISSVHVMINGSEILKKECNTARVFSSVDIELSNGTNFIQVYAVNSNGIKSVKEELLLNKTGKNAQDLYLFTIGASAFSEEGHNLKYAVKDANDFSKQFLKTKKYRKVYKFQFNDSNVSAAEILKSINSLKNISVNDEVVVFYAGHGLLNNELNYFLSTYDVDFEHPENNGLPYDSLIGALERVPARDKIVFIDACHSGELDKDDVLKKEEVLKPSESLVFRAVSGSVAFKENAVGLKNSLEVSKILFADLRENNGVCVVSSAGGAEYAIEGDVWNNGVFTYCLIKALKGNESDLNGDRKVYMDELQTYITNEVKKVSNGLQTPTSRSENIYHNIRIK